MTPPPLSQGPPDPLQGGPGSLYLAIAYAVLEAVAPQGVGPAGGQLGFFQSVGDRLRGVGNLVGAIGNAAEWLFDRVWSWIGGAIRWLWNQIWDRTEWVRLDAIGWFRNIARNVWDAVNWVRDRLWEAAGWVRDRVVDFTEWVRLDLIGWLQNVARNVWDAVNWVRGRLWDAATWVGDRVRDAITWLWNNVSSGIAGAVSFIGDRFRDAMEFVWVHLFEPAKDAALRKLSIPLRFIRGEYRDLEQLFDDILDPPILDNFVASIFLLLVAFASAIFMFFPAAAPANERLAQTVAAAIRHQLLSPAQLQDAWLRDLPVSDGIRDQLARAGYTDQDISTILQLARRPLSAGQVIEAERRGIPIPDGGDWHLQAQGYFPQDRAVLRALAQQLPTPSDLIRMGVREVFTPEIAQRFGQFEDFPPAFAQYMAQLGFSEFWARAYWAAHWDLPSATQGFEMFHRGVISRDELELLLRALDVMPFWRDKLIQISYNPITRVDVRRMYQAGVIGLDKVEETYRALGYSPEDARLLAEWVAKAYPRGSDGPGGDLRTLTVATIKSAYVRRLIDRDEAIERLTELDYSVDDAELIVAIWDFDLAQNPDQRSDIGLKELSRSVIERAYERGLMDFNTALVELVELGYTQDDAEVLLHLVDERLAEELTELEIEAVFSELAAGVIDESQAMERLRQFGLPDRRIQFLVQRAILRQRASPRRLTVSQLQQAVRRGLMSAEEMFRRLVAMGYNEADANILVALAGGS